MFRFKKSIVAVISAMAISATSLMCISQVVFADTMDSINENVSNSKIASAAAANLGTLSYWNSDGSDIGHWTATRKVYVKNLNQSGNFDPSSYLGFGVYLWSGSAGIRCDLSGTASNHVIAAYGGTKNELVDTGVFKKEDLDGNTVGFCSYTERTLEGTYTYNGNNKSCYLATKATIALVELSGKDKTYRQYYKTAAHELGHALGYYGHSPTQYEIMYPTVYDATKESLTNNEINHLKQVY